MLKAEGKPDGHGINATVFPERARERCQHKSRIHKGPFRRLCARPLTFQSGSSRRRLPVRRLSTYVSSSSTIMHDLRTLDTKESDNSTLSLTGFCNLPRKQVRLVFLYYISCSRYMEEVRRVQRFLRSNCSCPSLSDTPAHKVKGPPTRISQIALACYHDHHTNTCDDGGAGTDVSDSADGSRRPHRSNTTHCLHWRILPISPSAGALKTPWPRSWTLPLVETRSNTTCI